MIFEILQNLWNTSISIKYGAMVSSFVLILVLERVVEYGVLKFLTCRKKGKFDHFCRWEGMHVPCFDVLSSLDDGVIVINAKGETLFLNPIAEKMLGVSLDHINGRHYRDILRLVDAEQSGNDLDPFAEAKQTGKPVSIARNIRVMSSDGKNYRTADRVQAIFRAEAKEPHMIMVLHDGTERLKNKEQLKSTLSAFEYVSEMTSTAPFRLNPQTREMSGAKNLNRFWPVKDGLGAAWRDVVYPEDQVEFAEQEANLFSGESDKMTVNYRSSYLGELHYYRMETWLERNLDNEITLIGVIQDISTEKQLENQHNDELKRQNVILDAILNSIPSQVFIKDAQDNFRYKLANRNFTDYYHFSEKDVVDHTDFEIFPQEVATQLRGHDLQVCKSAGEVFRFDEDISYHLERKEVFTSLKVSFSTEDGHLYLLGVCVDITELVRAKQQEENNAERLNLTLNSIGDGVLTTDVQGNITMMNPVAERMTGVSAANAIGQPHEKVFRLIFPENDEPQPSPVLQALQSGQTFEQSGDAELLSASGKRYHISDNSAPILNARQQIIGAILVFRDITAEYENSEKLKASHELWMQIVNAMPTMLFAKDANDDFRYVLCNQAFASFLGRTPAEIIGKNDFELFVPRDDAEPFHEKDKQVIAQKRGIRYEEQATDTRGVRRSFRTYKQPIVDIDKRDLLLGVSVDISEIHALLQYEQVSNKVLTCAVTEAEFAPAIEKTLRTMMDCLDCDRVIFARLESDGLLHRFKSVYSKRTQPLEEAGLPQHEKLWNLHLQQYQKGEIVFYENFSDIPGGADFLKQNPSYPIHSAVGAPVFIKDEFYGALLVSFVEKHVFTELDKQTLHAITNMITLAQIRERQSKAVKLAEYHNQTILDNLDIPIWLYDNKGLIVRNNQAAEAMLKGQTIEKTPFACCDKLVCGVDEEHCPVHLCMITGKEHICDSRHIGNQEFIAKARPIFDAKGKLANVVKSYIDVTMLHHMIANQQLVNDCLANLMRENDAMKALELSLKDICTHLGASRGFIMKFDSEHKVLSMILNYSAAGHSSGSEERGNLPYSEAPEFEAYFKRDALLAVANLPEDLEKFGLHRWKKQLEESHVKSFYTHRILFDGKLWGFIGFFYEDNPKLWAPEELHFFGALAYGVELTLTRQKNQSDILDALEKAKAADRAKSIFLASMSHEIRTPLNAVIGFSELLKDETLPPKELREYLKGIYSAGNSLLALINDVLDLSKLEAGQMEFSCMPISFRDLLLDVGAIFKQKCAERNIYFTIDIPENMPTLWLDKLRIRQILFNLIGNAVKFTTHGGITVKAIFTPNAVNHGTLIFHIIDTGCGISEKDQMDVFEMFVQATALRGTQAAKNGTGLGLAICKRLTEQMAGSIELVSESGKGSDFFVTLRNIQYERIAAEEEKQEYSTAIPAPNMKVLLVDDVPMNLKVMAAMLKKLGLRSVSVNSGKEALARLNQEKFDFVLTDMWMPNMNGAELVAAIRNSSTQPQIPVFAVTADIEANANFSLDDFSGVLLKPITIAKLQDILTQLTINPRGMLVAKNNHK